MSTANSFSNVFCNQISSTMELQEEISASQPGFFQFSSTDGMLGRYLSEGISAPSANQAQTFTTPPTWMGEAPRTSVQVWPLHVKNSATRNGSILSPSTWKGEDPRTSSTIFDVPMDGYNVAEACSPAFSDPFSIEKWEENSCNVFRPRFVSNGKPTFPQEKLSATNCIVNSIPV